MERVLHIESLVHGGDGLARDDGRVVLVPLTVPGDHVRVEIEPPRGGVVRGRVLEIVEPGASRVAPPCPVAGICGGCQWQQVDYAEQLRQKEQNVAEALRRIGGWQEPPIRPIVPSPRVWRYRRRLRAHLTAEGWGFSRRASHELVPIAACLLVESEAEALAHAVAGALHSWNGVRSFAVDTAGRKGAAHIELAHAAGDAHRKRAAKLIDAVPRLAGVVVTGEGGSPVTAGEPVLVDREHRGLRIRPDLFAQANRLGARLLAEAVAGSIAPGSSVLEVFAGSGTLSLAIIERAGSLVATEGEGAALDLLRAALRERKHVRLIHGPAGRVMNAIADESAPFDHVVLDPPRTGAREIIPAIIRLAPARITYVSCDAPTLARDLRQLARAGWLLESVTPFDLFPHTHHVEAVAVLRRAG